MLCGWKMEKNRHISEIEIHKPLTLHVGSMG